VYVTRLRTYQPAQEEQRPKSKRVRMAYAHRTRANKSNPSALRPAGSQGVL
jgi:hypothetical protein